MSKLDKHALAVERVKSQLLHSGELRDLDYVQQIIILDLVDSIVISYLKNLYSDKYDQ